ncbi:response regulator [Candidatus Nomurabacteria bacterium]|nr:response regulator [Candidatus Nomurabacteria bacterium]
MTKILLVEDDKNLREIYGVRLLAEGYDIVSAGDGEEALAMAIKDRPALILSDVMMPKISGFDMLDILRSTTETKDIKVIMMTALSSEDQRKRGEQLGADRYLVKSQVGIEDVVRAVHEVLGDMPGANASQANSFTSGSSAAAPATPAAQPQPPQPQQSTTTPAPAAPTTPQPAPPQPSAPTTPQTGSTMPQPTAPFSTQRPANLAERVIQPLERQEDPNERPMSDRISDALDGSDRTEQQASEDIAAALAPPPPPPQPPTAANPLAPQPDAPSADPTNTPQQAQSPPSVEITPNEGGNPVSNPTSTPAQPQQ